MYEESVIVGFDTETCEGPPFAFQLYSPDHKKLTGIFGCNEKNITTKFLNHLRSNCRRGKVYTLYCHNLKFDTVSILWQCLDEVNAQRDKGYEFTFGGWRIFGVHGNPNFIFLEYGKGENQISVRIVDTFSWFKTSLKAMAEIVCPDLPKRDEPKGLGTKIFDVNDSEFAEYAMRDVEIAYRLGVAIDEFHKTHNIKQSVSVANMAANIFQKNYIQDEIVLPNDDHLSIAYHAYHGGKNHLVEGMNGWHTNIACIDIKSAYPYAMTEAPSFTVPKAYSGHAVFRARGLKSVPPWGVYVCSGSAAKGKWPVIFDHRFKPISGEFKNIALHGFEVNEALRTGTVKFSSVHGYYYDADKDGKRDTALQRFVNDFFAMKDKAKTEVERMLYKTLLNSLYGKFIERREKEIELEDGNTAVRLIAGRLYHSPLACGITAHTRALIHRLENEFDAIHTATDGLIVPQSRNGFYLTPYMPKSGLGSLALEAEGNAAIVRCKLYAVYVNDPRWITPKTRNSFRIEDWKVAKFAMHGHMGKLFDLEDFVLYGKRNYIAQHVNQLRESKKRDVVPNQFVKEQRVLKAPAFRQVFNHRPSNKRKSLQ